MDLIRKTAHDVINSLGIAPSIQSIFIEETDSPWNEKSQIKRKKHYLDVKITVWKDEALLFGRVFRLFLYIQDVLDPVFQYDPGIAPEEHKEPEAMARYNQIWSLYVDSRLERKGMENFFDRIIRRNLFIDMERRFSWGEARTIFQKLWDKETFTYPEIIDYSHNLNKLVYEKDLRSSVYPEIEINQCIDAPHVKQHMERISSTIFKGIVNDLLNFTAYICKDSQIHSSYYGISFLYHRRIFVEMIPTSENFLYLTFLNPDSEGFETIIITENSNTTDIQETIKKVYHKIFLHSQT